MSHATCTKRHAALLALGLAAAGLAQAQATITHDKALAGSVTPGDTAGYPVTISQPGSYKLMSNLYVPYGASGIEVSSKNVTIDLNGFGVIGTGQCSQDANSRIVSCTGASVAGTGINSKSNEGMVVRNGTVRGFQVGITVGNDGLIENAVISHNNGSGIWSNSSWAPVQIVGTRSMLNGGSGMYLSIGTVSRSTVSQNGVNGIQGDSLLVQVMDSMAANNRELGFRTVTLHNSLNTGANQSNRSLVRSTGGNTDDNGTY